MHSAEYEVEVNVSYSEAWEKLKDFTAAIHYVPGLVSAVIDTEQTEGVGASRTVSQGQITINETITEWHEGKGFTLRLHRGDKGGPMPPVKEAFYDYGLVERDGKVYLSNAIRWEMGLGPLGALLNAIGLGKILGKSMVDSTIAQKVYYETGETVTPAMLKEAKAALK